MYSALSTIISHIEPPEDTPPGLVVFCNEMSAILVDYLLSYARIISINVPKNIKMLNQSELEFAVRREKSIF